MIPNELKQCGKPAFTLIELLVVISIIGLLAAMVIPMAGVAARNARLKRAEAELQQLKTVIDRYKAQKGFYPPDNTNDVALPQLFYELTGTFLVNSNDPAKGNAFVRINGIESIWQPDVTNIFHVGGFMNSSAVGSITNTAAIREADAKNFWPGLSSGEYGFYSIDNVTVAVFGLPIEGPHDLTTVNNTKLNPWNYNSSNPTNNPDSYDLWIDVLNKQTVLRICNWSKEPVVVATITNL